MATQTTLPPSSHGHGRYGTVGSLNMDLGKRTQTVTVPVVRHIITDEDAGIIQQETKSQPINLYKVAKLLVDPHSAMLLERHAHALRKVVKHYPKGFLIKDLVVVFKILNVCADRVSEHPLYIEPMCEILKICSLPSLKANCSDETAYGQIAAESISQLGYLMRVPSAEVRLQICRALHNFITKQPLKQENERLKPNSLEFNRRIVEESDVAETLVKSLALIENHLETKQAVLEVLQTLSRNSEKNCERMLQAQAAYILCSHLMEYDPSGQLLFRSSEILWNLLENGDHQEIATQLSSLECISQLQDAFIQQVTQGFSHYDRQLRNDLLVLASLIASTTQNATFVETGFAKQLLLLATFQEVKSHHALVRHLKLMPNHEDFEIKKLLMNILVVLSKDPAVLSLYSEGKLLLALFSYVKSNENTTGPQEWTVAQFEELQLHAMAALSTLGPLMVDDFMMCQGSTRLLLLLEWCTGSDDFSGQGNSFHGKGGRSSKRAQMRYCLRLIRSMVSTKEDNVLQDLVDQGAIHQLTGILKTMVARRTGEDAVAVEMQSDMLFILSCLCDGDMHKKELFGTVGVDVVTEYLKMKPQLLTNGIGYHKLMLAAVDCLWCAVVGCYITEDYFLEKEGVFLLIDILENCPKNMHNLVLGCLLDLCENSKAIPHVNAWRGKQDISAAHLFCNIWRQEEQEMGVARTDSGAIADCKKPLTGALQENQGVTSLPASCPSQAIVDVFENMRAKLYAMFCKLGFIELPGISNEDHVTLTIIEHYLDFKMGEVWSEIILELEQDGVRPVSPDLEALDAISRTVLDRAKHVSDVQQELLEAHKQQDLIEEQEFYAEIRENHRQTEKAIKNFHDYIARTSNYVFLKAAKERQELSIDASRIQKNFKSMETIHNTDIAKLNTTTVIRGSFVSPDFLSVKAYASSSPVDSLSTDCERSWVCSCCRRDTLSTTMSSPLPPCMQLGHSSCLYMLVKQDPRWKDMQHLLPPYTSPHYTSPHEWVDMQHKSSSMPAHLPTHAADRSQVFSGRNITILSTPMEQAAGPLASTYDPSLESLCDTIE